MNDLIKTVYIITDDNEKFNKIKSKIGSKIPIIKVNGIKLDKNKKNIIDQNISETCKYMCQNTTISKWLTHYNLWNNVYKKGNTGNILIIDDEGMPIDSFLDMFEEYTKELPKNWDFVYLGCIGSCNTSLINDAYYRLLKSRSNNDVYINDKKMIYVIEPGYPLGLYGYMLSKKGIEKLVNNSDLKKVQTDLDYFIAQDMMINTDLHIYSFNPPLINYNPIKNKIVTHEIMQPITEKFQLSETTNITTLWDTPMYYFRPLDLDLTYFTFVLLMLAFMVGYLMNEDNQRIFIGIITIIQLLEMALSKSNKRKLKNLIFELVLIYTLFYIGTILQKK